MTEKSSPENQDLDHLVKNESIQVARGAAGKAALGLGLIAAGFAFDYATVSDPLCFLGGFITGSNTIEAINYLRYTLSGDKPTDYTDE